MSAEWYVIVQGIERGPLAAADLRKLAIAEVLRPGDRVKKGAEGRWVSADKVKGLFDGIAPSIPTPIPTAKEPVSVPPVIPAPAPSSSSKSNRTAYVIGACATLAVTVVCTAGFIATSFWNEPAEPKADSNDKVIHEKLASL